MRVLRAGTPRPHDEFPRHTAAERRADAAVHALGLTLGAAGCAALAAVPLPGADLPRLVAIGAYAAGLLAMLGCSALYNLTPEGARKRLFRRLDHAAIFLMIAGTYTPFALVAVGGRLGTGLLALVWTVAAGGTAAELLGLRRHDGLSVAAYLLLGWSVLPALRPALGRAAAARARAAGGGGRALQRGRRLPPVGAPALPQRRLARLRAGRRGLPLRGRAARARRRLTARRDILQRSRTSRSSATPRRPRTWPLSSRPALAPAPATLPGPQNLAHGPCAGISRHARPDPRRTSRPDGTALARGVPAQNRTACRLTGRRLREITLR